jgi:hypothetical protein
MAKALCIISLIVALGLLLLFGLDLAIGVPFRKANMPMDVGSVVAAALLAYMSWSSYREQP